MNLKLISFKYNNEYLLILKANQNYDHSTFQNIKYN